jgi:iron(III) transport system permease protein
MLISLLMAAPLGYMLYYGARVEPGLWEKLWKTQLLGLFFNSLLLMLIVTVGSLVLGLTLAWLVERTDLSGHTWLRPLLVSPLVIPCYIVAIAYVGFLGKRGLLERIFEVLGMRIEIPSLYGLAGTAVVLVFATFPYVFALAAAALRKTQASLEEAGRSLGLTAGQVSFRVILPLLAPALLSGAVLSALYALSDFGVASIFRYQTFTTQIYLMFSHYEREAASALSLVLIGITILILFVQTQLWKERRVSTDKISLRSTPRVSLGLWRWPALLLVWGALLASFFLPISIFLFWFIESFSLMTSIPWMTNLNALIVYALNSFWPSALAATLAMGLSILPAYWRGRRPEDRLGQSVAWLAQSGIALPGILLALGLAFVLLRWFPALYFSVSVLVLIYLLRFFPQALQSVSAGFAQIPERLEEGARLLGCTSFGIFWRVIRPLLQPALLAGWTLVFLNSVRELPATLLLHPAGFETLTVRVWMAASEGYYGAAAPAALLLIVLSLPLLFFLWREHESALS